MHNPRQSWAGPPNQQHLNLHSPYPNTPGSQAFSPVPNSANSYQYGHGHSPSNAGAYQPPMQNYGQHGGYGY